MNTLSNTLFSLVDRYSSGLVGRVTDNLLSKVAPKAMASACPQNVLCSYQCQHNGYAQVCMAYDAAGCSLQPCCFFVGSAC